MYLRVSGLSGEVEEIRAALLNAYETKNRVKVTKAEQYAV
jgi:hypothetical protein